VEAIKHALKCLKGKKLRATKDTLESFAYFAKNKISFELNDIQI